MEKLGCVAKTHNAALQHKRNFTALRTRGQGQNGLFHDEIQTFCSLVLTVLAE
jgi:hypothetical protein